MMSIILGTGVSVAQTENSGTAFEGEITSNLTSLQKMNTQVKTKNILAKMILKNVMKKVENSGFYTGSYTATTICKGNKSVVHTPYNNSYMIIEKNGDQMKTTTYYPYIKKGYYTNTSISANQQQMELMRKGKVEKTGETMEILGYKCEVYKVKYEVKQDSAGTVSTTNLQNVFAICQDPSLGDVSQEVVPGVTGVPLKFINNTASLTNNEMLSLDFLMYIASITTAIKKRSVADSELAVPDDIKLIDADKDSKGMLKITEENMKYLQKNKLWVEKNPDEIKIYDSLNEDWEY